MEWSWPIIKYLRKDIQFVASNPFIRSMIKCRERGFKFIHSFNTTAYLYIAEHHVLPMGTLVSQDRDVLLSFLSTTKGDFNQNVNESPNMKENENTSGLFASIRFISISHDDHRIQHESLKCLGNMQRCIDWQDARNKGIQYWVDTGMALEYDKAYLSNAHSKWDQDQPGFYDFPCSMSIRLYTVLCCWNY